jgi:hypothetical protein
MPAMQVRRSTSWFIVLAASSGLACSSGSSSKGPGPIIDSIQVPSSFTVSGGTYEVQGTLTFHDSGSSVTALRERIPAYSLDSQVALSSSASQGTMQVTLGFQAQGTVASGTQVEIDVSLIDAQGSESSVEVEQVTVP